MDEIQHFSDIYNTNAMYNLEAEQSVLGAILLDSSCISVIIELIRAECFFVKHHLRIFEIMIGMYSTGKVMDFITILDQVKRDNIFETQEDAKIFLTKLAQVVPTTTNVAAYAKIVQERYYVRRLIESSKDIVEKAEDGSTDAATLLDAAEQSIYDIRKGREANGLVHINSVILEAYDTLQKLSGDNKDDFMGIKTGFTHLDRVTSGLNRSDLILIAARPAMGKTSFALNIAENVATKSNKTVAIFSLEMSNEQLVQRMLSSHASVKSNSLRTGELSGDDWIQLARSSQIIGNSPIYLDDTPSITVGEMKAKLRRLKDLGLVIIDYLQLMSSGRRVENRVQEVSEMTRNLKIMAKELNVPIITLSQLSRGPDSRSEHRPVLSDLRESGSIEQDADMVMFLYRDDYYNQDSADHNVAECIIAKNRHGETETIKLRWDGQFTRFSTLELLRHE